jgi:endonuclease/exonuclease/phosphatase family metal-dependent hydrolase
MANNLKFGWLKGLVKKILAVAEPVGFFHVHPLPPNQPEQNSKILTVLSANLWHDFPRYRRMSERMEIFARLAEAEGANIILLQEVSRTPKLNMDEWLADRLNMACVYTRANGHASIGFEEGLAVLSRFRLSKPFLQELKPAFSPFVHRLALGARVETPFGNLPVFSVHLGLLRRQNARQLQNLKNWITQVTGGGSALVGGDFNAHETAPQILQTRKSWLDIFRQLHPRADGTTHELRLPWGGLLSHRRLDYIFLQPGRQIWTILESCHLVSPGNPHSDHRAVLARLEFPKGWSVSVP